MDSSPLPQMGEQAAATEPPGRLDSPTTKKAPTLPPRRTRLRQRTRDPDSSRRESSSLVASRIPPTRNGARHPHALQTPALPKSRAHSAAGSDAEDGGSGSFELGSWRAGVRDKDGPALRLDGPSRERQRTRRRRRPRRGGDRRRQGGHARCDRCGDAQLAAWAMRRPPLVLPRRRLRAAARLLHLLLHRRAEERYGVRARDAVQQHGCDGNREHAGEE